MEAVLPIPEVSFTAPLFKKEGAKNEIEKIASNTKSIQNIVTKYRIEVGVSYHEILKVPQEENVSLSSLSVLSILKHLKRGGAKEVVLHIQDTRRLMPYLANRRSDFNKTDTARLEEIKKQLESIGYEVKTILGEGVPFVEINKIAQEEKFV